MPVTTSCPECKRQLILPDALLGKLARCPACKATFHARPDGPPSEAVQVVPSVPPPVAPRPLPPEEEDLVEVDEWQADEQERPARKRARGRVEPFSFKALDPRKVLKRTVTCHVTDEGLRIIQGKKVNILFPVGSEAAHLDGARFRVSLDGQDVELIITEFLLYHHRLAEDVCAWLNGEIEAPVREDYQMSPVLFLPALLPLGIPIITGGGAIWGALGGGLGAACLGIMRQEKMSVGLRLLLSLLLTALGYAILAVVIVQAQK